jgi:hypothetical protein
MLSPTERAEIVNLSKGFIGILSGQIKEKERLGICTKKSRENVLQAETILYSFTLEQYGLLDEHVKDVLHYRLVSILNINFNNNG